MISLIFYIMLAFKVSLYCILQAHAALLCPMSKLAKCEPAAGSMLAKQQLPYMKSSMGLRALVTAQRNELSHSGELAHNIQKVPYIVKYTAQVPHCSEKWECNI